MQEPAGRACDRRGRRPSTGSARRPTKEAAAGSGAPPYALGLLLQLTGLLTDLAIGSAAGLFRDAVLSRPRVRCLLDGAAGTVYGALAVLLVMGVVHG